MKTNEHNKAFKVMNLLNEIGFNIELVDGKFVSFNQGYEEILSDRQVIKWARIYSSEGQRTPIKRNVKEFRHRNNRAKTREDIHRENFDSFSQGELRKDEDIWNWD